MRTIAHVSDLHFGAEAPGAADALAADVQQLQPSLLVVSGDFTQRARRRQFMAARDFLRRLPQPQLAVPGNHDIPLYDVFRRAFLPLTRYRRFIAEDVDPMYHDEELLVLGLNTARSATWKNGRISVSQMEGLARHLETAGERLKVVVTHHPFIPPPDDNGIELVGRAVRAVEVLDRGGVDLLLAGHLHRGYAADIRTQYPAARRAIVSAQAGTAISHRLRGNETNSYNVIRLARHQLEIEVRALADGRFSSLSTHRYEPTAEGWHAVSG